LLSGTGSHAGKHEVLVITRTDTASNIDGRNSTLSQGLKKALTSGKRQMMRVSKAVWLLPSSFR